ncbi:MAG: HAMP domain-containing sensor histidine kinase [Solirubrobacterales bacterium]
MILRGVLLAALAAAAAAALTAAVYGGAAARVIAEILLPLGCATALLAGLFARRSRRIGSLTRQVAIVALLAGAQLVIAAWLFIDRMFVSRHDAFFTALLVGYATLVAGWAAWALGRRAVGDLDRVRDVLTAVGEGRRDVRSGVAGRDELAALSADVDAMIARLDAEETARRSLIASVSHDLRTPITALQLTVEGVADGVFEPERQQAELARIKTHVRALSALIDDLFELSRLESGEIRWSLERVELSSLVGETVDAMRPAADAGAVEVRADLPAAPLAARANPEQLQRVLFNLIQNAIRHTPADGSVVVRVEPGRGGELELEVADHGDGIPAEERAHVFDAFFRGGGASARTDGSAGLGLAIARAIVEAHGGRIWLADADLGTRVRFTLPRA